MTLALLCIKVSLQGIQKKIGGKKRPTKGASPWGVEPKGLSKIREACWDVMISCYVVAVSLRRCRGTESSRPEKGKYQRGVLINNIWCDELFNSVVDI